MNVRQLAAHLERGEVITLDGGCGTELGRRGIATPPPLWSAEALRTRRGRAAVAAVHRSYIKAGAEIITANTFRGQAHVWEEIGAGAEARQATLAAAGIVRQAVQAAPNTLAAGSTTSLEDCYKPALELTNFDLDRGHRAHAQNLRAGGLKFMIAETIPSTAEGWNALNGAAHAGLDYAISFHCREDGRLPTGETLTAAVQEIEKSFNPLFVGVNCVSLETAGAALDELRTATNRPVAVYANGLGTPEDSDVSGALINHNRAEYAAAARQWVYQGGAQLIGGCCCTGPDNIVDLSQIATDYNAQLAA